MWLGKLTAQHDPNGLSGPLNQNTNADGNNVGTSSIFYKISVFVLIRIASTRMPTLVAQLDAHSTGDQVVGLIATGSSNIISD